MKLYFRTFIILLTTLGFLACKNKAEKENAIPRSSSGTYFSIIDFTKDQWATYHGQPFSLQRITTFNGQQDSVMLSALKMQWSTIFKKFFETDISDPKYLNQYDFSTFEEPTTQARTFTYTAKKPELFTQKLEITADLYTRKIRSIYIETQKNTFWNKQSQKLLYAPLRVIQIHEWNDPKIGTDKDLLVEYRFD